MTTKIVTTVVFLIASRGALAQPPRQQAPPGRIAEWVTSGSDAQRSNSIPHDPKISVEGLAGGIDQPGFQFLWKSKLAGAGAQLTPAILLDRYIGYRGFRSLAFFAGTSNTIYALDSDLNKIEWQKRLETAAPAAASGGCPGIAAPVMTRSTTNAAYPRPGSGSGRVSWARSDVGEPGEGAVNVPSAWRAAAAALAPRPSTATPPRPPGGPRPTLIYILSSDGMLHTLNVSNGDELAPPKPFVPAQSNAQGLIVIDNIAYAATHDCGGANAGVWAMDLVTRQVNRWKPEQGDLAGAVSPAFGPDETIYVTGTAGNLVALHAKTLAVKDAYAAGAEFTSSPVVFAHQKRTIVAAATRDGSIHLIDAASPDAALFKTPPASSFARSLATWQSPAGDRWLLAESSSSLSAWKLVEHDGAIALEPAWTSQEMAAPLPPMIINGVVFVLSSRPAILHALDGATGRTLWDSGKTISGIAAGGLSGGSSQLYLSTQDGTIYAFGFPIEH